MTVDSSQAFDKLEFLKFRWRFQKVPARSRLRLTWGWRVRHHSKNINTFLLTLGLTQRRLATWIRNADSGQRDMPCAAMESVTLVSPPKLQISSLPKTLTIFGSGLFRNRKMRHQAWALPTLFHILRMGWASSLESPYPHRPYKLSINVINKEARIPDNLHQ